MPEGPRSGRNTAAGNCYKNVYEAGCHLVGLWKPGQRPWRTGPRRWRKGGLRLALTAVGACLEGTGGWDRDVKARADGYL